MNNRNFKFYLYVFLLILYFSNNIFAISKGMPTESENEPKGAGSIIFDTSKIPLENNTEEKVSLFNYNLYDNDIEFLASGYWQSLVIAETSMTFASNSVNNSTPSITFSQNVDLSLWLMINNHYYFEANFADEFEKNTIAAGYIGDGYLKSFRVANRGIAFPNDYSVSNVNRGIGGGENEAPGFSINFAGDKWRADGTFRYDMLQAEDKTWYGKNSVVTNEIELSNWKAGNQFAFQNEKILQEIDDVFVESTNGDYQDSTGKKYKKLDKSQYLLIASKKMLILSKDVKTTKSSAIAVQFSSIGENLFNSTLDKFLQKTQDWFEKVNLDKYYFFKKNKEKLWGNISGNKVAFIQYPTGFSPFVCAFRYDCGTSSVNDASIASKFTEIVSKEYSAMVFDEYSDFAEKDFFDDKHFYTDVYLTDTEDTDASSPAVRFPLAKNIPNVYLGSSNITSDLILRVRTYTPVKRYDIGIKAIPGTIRVYKNGVIDSGATYDTESGTINLSTTAGAGDHIYATWYEENKDANTGILTGAAGFEYFFTDKIRSDISFSTRWTLTNSFTDENFQAPGFFTLAQGFNYESENVTFSNTIAGSFEKENTTGTYRILGMDDRTSRTIYLSKKAGENLPKTVVPILNLENETIFLEKEFDGSEKALEGIKDDKISGYAIPISWDFKENITKKRYWAAETIELPETSNILSSASNIEIAIKTLSLDDDYKVYLQLGVNSSSTSNTKEDAENIQTWDITNFVIKKTGWQIISITFDDETRSVFTTSKYSNARIIITSESNKSGTLYFGPYQINGISFSVQADDNCLISSYQKSDSTLNNSTIKKFNDSTNYVQYFDWRYIGNEKDSKITAIRYFKETDISNYNYLNFFFKASFSKETVELKNSSIADDEFLTFILDNSESKITAKIDMKKDIVNKLSNNWHSVEIDLISKTLYIDGKQISKNDCNLTIDTSNIPSRFKIIMNPIESDNKIYKTGTLCIDELYVSDNSPYFVIQDKAKVTYKKQGNIISIGDYSFLKDFETTASSNFNSTIFTNENKTDKSILFTNGDVKATITNLKVEAEIAKSSEKSSISSAGHKIETENPIFSFLSLKENYNFDSDGETLSKTDYAKISTKYFNIQSDLSAVSDSWALTQDVNLKSEIKIKKTQFSVNNKLSQKLNTSTNKEKQLKTNEYFNSWLEASIFQFDKGDENASKREILNNAKIEHHFDFLKMNPNITASSNGTYKSAISQMFIDKTSLNFELPFKIQKNTFSLSWKKTSEESSSIKKGGDYKKDYTELYDKVSEKDWFFKTIPINDIVNDNISDTVSKKTNENEKQSQTLSYSSIYSLSWNRKLFATKYDFFIPNMVQASFSRDITAASNLSDLYQAQLKVGTTAFNMFGKNGLVPFFDWYEQDEYITSISATARFPKKNPDEIKYLVTGYTQATFFITTTDFLKTGLELSFETDNTWSGKTTVIWKRIGDSFVVDGIINFIRPLYDAKKITHTRTDNINLSASHTSSNETVKKYEIEYTHKLDSEISKYVTINSFFTLNFNTIIEKLSAINFSTGIGCTIKF